MQKDPTTIPLKKDAACYYMVFFAALLFILPAIYYNHPEFGFNRPEYGLGIFMLILFPLIWLCLYFIADKKIRKNRGAV
jgi:hypothetical protein